MYWATGARSLFLVATAPLTNGRSRRPLQRHGEDARNWTVSCASRASLARQTQHEPYSLDVPPLPVVGVPRMQLQHELPLDTQLLLSEEMKRLASSVGNAREHPHDDDNKMDIK